MVAVKSAAIVSSRTVAVIFFENIRPNDSMSVRAVVTPVYTVNTV
jgi:hypothetical protein